MMIPKSTITPIAIAMPAKLIMFALTPNRCITRNVKSMPSGKEELIGQCITHLEKTQTLGGMLAVVHALNDGEFLLRCHTDVNENELAEEFNEMFRDEVKNNTADEPL
jgi:hypothetical protein